MIGILVAVCAICVCSMFVQGFNLWTIGAFISTLMFCGRKVGYFCKYQHLVTIEIVTGFITIVFQLVFKHFVLLQFIIMLILRLVFLGIALYDKVAYVYFQEIRRKEE